MSSSNMMYNYWLRNKKIRMARISGPYTEYPNDTLLYSPVGQEGHLLASPDRAVEHGNPLTEPGRLIGKSNNVYITTSPLTGHNERAEWNTGNASENTRRYMPLSHQYEVSNEFNKLTSDYPEEFFNDEPEHALVLHFRSSHDTLPNTLPGNTHVIAGVPHSERYSRNGLTPEQRQGVRRFIIKELADRAGSILVGNHWGRRNGVAHALPEEDIGERQRDYAHALEQLHHEYDSLPDDIRPRELGNYIQNKVGHLIRNPSGNTNNHNIHILAELAEALNPRQEPITPTLPSNYYEETGPGEELDLGDLKNSLGDLLGGKNEPNIRFNSEGGFTEE